MVELSVCYFMNIFYSGVACFAAYANDHPLLVVLLSFIVAVVLIGNVHLSRLLCETHLMQLVYDYGSERGPHSWTIPGPNQSPININTPRVELRSIREHLMWNHYNDLPVKVTIENNGKTVIVRAKYAGNSPTLSGADLLHCYTFDSLSFHWSFWNTEGSEHMIDGRKYPMEIQAIHKTGPVMSCIPAHDTLVLAYLFEISAHNQFLDPIILNLHRIRRAGTAIDISPFPLAWLCYPFRSGFYSYGGSRTVPPCTEGVEWFINSEPLTIGENQIMEFRKLFSSDNTTRIIRNSRPVQLLNNNRIVHLNEYDTCGNVTNCGLQLSEVENGEDC